MFTAARSNRQKSRKPNGLQRPLALEALESREVPTISNLLPTMAELEASTTDIFRIDLSLGNQQRVVRQETNVAGEVDIYSFTPLWSGSYRFTGDAVRGSKMDPVIAVYDPTGERIAFNDDASSRTTNSLASATLAAGVTYQFAVSSFDTTSVGKYSVSVTGMLQDDAYENNDTLGQARALPAANTVVLTGVMADSQDFYRFSLAGPAKAGSSVSIDFANAQGDLDLRLLDSRGQLLRSSAGVGDRELIDLSGLVAGKYHVQIFGYAGSYNPSYQLTLDAAAESAAPPAIPADAFESNNTLSSATNLGSITENKQWGNLTLTRGDKDFFKFTLGSAGSAASEVLVNFRHSQGDVDAELLDSAGKRIAISQSVGDQERFSLEGLAAGSYSLRVYGYKGAVSPAYGLVINHQMPTTPVDPPVAPPVNPPTPPSTGAWTIMVYMTATDLATFGFQDVNEMEDALTRLAPGVNISIFWDQWNQRSYATGGGAQAAWGTAGRAILQADANMNSVATTFDIIGERNTGDPATLRDFITWSAANAPASNYALVMWNHGGGLSGVNFDDESGNNSITIGDLRSAITQAGVPLQLLAYDACLMGIVEQAYEARELATVQLASEEVIDGPGYNYRTVFQALNSNPQAVGATALAQGMVSSFTASYGSDGFSTFSAVASASVTGVTTALRAFTTASRGLTSANLTAVRSILAGVTRFDFPENIDLKQFMQRVSTTTSLPASVRAAAASVVTAVDQTVFSRMADSRQTGGLAIYLPSSTAQESSAYGLFTGFDAATGWSGFVNRLLGRTTSTRLGSGAGLSGMATRGIHVSGIGAQAAPPEFPGRILANALSPVNAVRPQLEAQVLPRASSVGHGRPPEVFVASTEPARSPALVASVRREAAVDAMFVSSLDEGFASAI